MFQTLLFTHLPASVPETLVGGGLCPQDMPETVADVVDAGNLAMVEGCL